MTNVNLTDQEADAIFEQVLSCKPAISPQDVNPLADLVGSQERVGRQWRLAALLAGKDGSFYRKLSEDAHAAEAMVIAAATLQDFSRLLREMADLAECANTRVMVAGCNHEHFQDWLKEDAGGLIRDFVCGAYHED